MAKSTQNKPESTEAATETEAPKPPAEAKPAAVLLTPLEWRDKLGLVRRGDRRLPQRVDVPDWRHQAADTLHGWSDDAHHFQGDKALKLSESDYRKALEAAAKYPTVPPHMQALSRLKTEKFKDFKPKKSTREATSASPKIGEGAQIGQGRLGA